MTNERAKELLEGFGLSCEPEPAWVKAGKKPDFYSQGHASFWCEVKTLGPGNDSEISQEAFGELRNRLAGVSLPGRGIAYVNGNLDHRDAKAVTTLLKRALPRFGEEGAPDRIVALIPTEPIYRNFARFSVSTESEGRAEVHACLSGRGTYGLPNLAFPSPDDQIVRLEPSQGEGQDLPAYDLVTSTNFRVAIFAWPDTEPFELITAGPAAVSRPLTTVTRIRSAVAEANGQFKNALEYREVPSLLVIFHDDLFVVDERIMLSALYGDLKYVFPADGSDGGELVLDRNGILSPHKNRSTSAVMYVPNSSEPFIIHNRWADDPFPRSALPWRAIVVLDDGTVQRIDKSKEQGG